MQALKSAIALAVVLLSTGCAGSPPPAASHGQAASAPSAPAGATEAATPHTADATTTAAPSASVEEFSVSGDDMLTKIVFSNPGASACEFGAYTLVWPGGKKRVDAKTFHVVAGAKRERNLRIHKSDGDISSLNKDSAHVEVETDCGAH